MHYWRGRRQYVAAACIIATSYYISVSREKKITLRLRGYAEMLRAERRMMPRLARACRLFSSMRDWRYASLRGRASRDTFPR